MPGCVEIDSLLSLYRRSFPAGERRSDEAIRRSIDSAEYRLLTETRDGILFGFALLYVPTGDDFALLEYLAVDPAHRNQGIGTLLFRSAAHLLADRHLMVEVEAASLGADARRRQSFYERLGCRRMPDVAYQLPLPNDPPPMELMIRGIGRTDAQTIPRAALRRWLGRIYRDVYDCPADDSRIVQMMRE